MNAMRGVWALLVVAGLQFAAADARAQLPSWFRPPTIYRRPPAAVRRTPEAGGEANAPTDDSAATDEYVDAPELANQLRKIDPATKVDWDTHVLRFTVNGQKFALFPTTGQMV